MGAARAEKRRPPNGYAAKFSTPYCIAFATLHGDLGLDAFSDAAVAEGRVRELAARVGYVVDPANPYPNAFTGHIRAALRDGLIIEERQPHLRGGASEPLSRAELEAKFAANARIGGWSEDQIGSALALIRSLWGVRIDLRPLRA